MTKKMLLFLLTIFLSLGIFQPINSYALEDDEMKDLLNGAIRCEGYAVDTLRFYSNNYRDNTIFLYATEYNLPYYKANNPKSFTKYEDLKTELLKYLTKRRVVGLLGDEFGPVFLNVNGEIYAKEIEGSLGESGLWYNKLRIIYKNEKCVVTIGEKYFADNSLWHKGLVVFEKENGEWRVSMIDGSTDLDRYVNYEDQRSSVFSGYIRNVVTSFIVSENVNCGYEKFSQKVDDRGRISMDIVVDSFDSESYTGKGLAILDEYDENGNVISQHKIVVEIGENLSEKITDYDLSKDNPDTADINLIFYAVATAAFTTTIFLIRRKNYN